MSTPSDFGQVPPVPAGPLPGQYKQQAADAVGQVQADPGTDATETLEQIKQNAVRAALGEFEQQLAATLANAQASFDQQHAAMQEQIALLTRQLATVRSQAGPPEAQLLATAVATRVKSIAAANPDLGAMHFAGVIGQGEQLAEEVKAIAEGQQPDTGRAEQLVHGMAAWFSRVHPRISPKMLEGMHVVMDELERIAEGLPELLPVAAAVAKAV